jgi:hypothetical protein
LLIHDDFVLLSIYIVPDKIYLISSHHGILPLKMGRGHLWNCGPGISTARWEGEVSRGQGGSDRAMHSLRRGKPCSLSGRDHYFVVSEEFQNIILEDYE